MASGHHTCTCRSSTAAAAPAPCYCYSVHPAARYHPPPPDPHSQLPCFPDHQHHPHLCPNSPYSSQTLLHHHRHQNQCCPPQPFLQELHHHCQTQQQLTPQPVVSSLLRRIATLESSLRRRSVSSHSLRDAAARTIQAQFRAFLVRRSRTLRQLKQLASIKSAFNVLKSSASDSNPQAVILKANRLLLKLDSIQGSDPMIRDGKKSISRELVKLIELIDGISVEKYGHPNRVLKNVKRSSSNNRSKFHILHEMEKMESIINKYIDLRKSVEEEDDEFENPRISVIKKSGILQTGKRDGEFQSKANKVVTFADDGHNVRILKPSISREDSYRMVDANEELVGNLCRRVEDLGVALTEVDDGEAQESSDSETEHNCSSIKEDGKFEKKRVDHGGKGGFFFSPPLPVKMEGRVDSAD
ncbi:unnamed protein product [Cuscuta epithymum]|uniref:BAG family molecular chaperone regulator 8, chloroplastic n=1 Tax=Cuscuta epithymum TaxID=186058 RepID=A0AAV0D4C6_9ASTE|nr:unnamed protein product [Cuscuta epithymum]